MNKIIFILGMVMSGTLLGQTYELILPLQKGVIPKDKYGNVVYERDYISTDVLYIGSEELDYILSRGEYSNGVLLGTFEINDLIRFNTDNVNTVWTPRNGGYYLNVWKENETTETTDTETTVYFVSDALGYPNSKSYFISRKSLLELSGKKY